MSITNTKAKSVYNANGTTIEWNLGFTYDDTVSNVHIYIVDANDNETEVTSNYSIADGVLTYPTTASGLEPLAEGNKLVIVRDTPRTQDIELTSNGKLDGKVLEGGYDKLTLQVQELTEQVGRAIKVPISEDSADNFLDPITAITEAKKEALVEIAQATTPAETAKDTAVAKAQVATEQATIATNAATSAKAAQVGAEQAEQNATAQAEKAENAVTAFVEGLGTAQNAVIDLGTFDGKTSVTSSRTIEFDKKPIAVSLRFSDTNKKLWINGTNSTVGIEVIDNTHCNLFYSIASADFVGQNAVKGPFVVQAIIQYSLLYNSATETKMGAVQLATKAEAEAGTNDAKAMTPLKTKYAIEANATVQTLRNDVAVIEGKIPQAASETNQLADKKFVQDLTSALNFIQWVDTLPETGESKYIYAVPREETDTDGKQIAALYLWDGSAWRGASVISAEGGSGFDFVVESFKDNSGSWYRKYKSGWLEQGGVTPALEIPLTSSSVATVTFLKPFSKLYSCHVSPSSWASSVVMDFGSPLSAAASNTIWAISITNSVITVDKGVQAIWYACGQGAN